VVAFSAEKPGSTFPENALGFRGIANAAEDRRARSPYDIDLDATAANFQPLTPLSFLERAASGVSRPDRDHSRALRRSYAELLRAHAKLVGARPARHRRAATTVSAVLRQHAGDARMPLRRAMTGGVLNTINTRLDAAVVAFSSITGGQGGDRRPRVLQAHEGGAGARKVKPLVIDYDDPEFTARRAAGRRSNTRVSSRPAIRGSPGDADESGTRSR